MGRFDRRRRVATTLAVAGICFAILTACDEAGGFTAEDYLNEFLGSRSPTEQAANNTAHTGDDGVDGVLEAAAILDDIAEADSLHVQAKQLISRDTEHARAADLLDQAIALRPDDLRYRRDRARVALMQDDGVTGRQQWAEQDRIAESQGLTDKAWYWEGSGKDALITALDLLNEHGDNPLYYEPAEDRRAFEVYTRVADSAERAAQINTISGAVDQAAVQMELAEEYRAKAARHNQ